MNAKIQYLAEPEPGAAAVGEDGKGLRLFLAGQILHLGLKRKVGFEEVAEANGMTRAELQHIMQHGGYKDIDLWKLFAILRSLGAAVVVAVDPAPDFEEGVVLWSRLSRATAAAAPSAKPSTRNGP
ncbi:hypothetical protein ACQR1W_12790 [Bradyrhizobium sp. HKCCYLS1011]|uniref:hypothetical protein n=1 Tax=Bradyrhizobium sp. HKCCYLS1011 TaxID=3420733 RepID=UPI003EBF3F94